MKSLLALSICIPLYFIHHYCAALAHTAMTWADAVEKALLSRTSDKI